MPICIYLEEVSLISNVIFFCVPSLVLQRFLHLCSWRLCASRPPRFSSAEHLSASCLLLPPAVTSGKRNLSLLSKKKSAKKKCDKGPKEPHFTSSVLRRRTFACFWKSLSSLIISYCLLRSCKT